MKLTKVRIREFQSVQDSNEFDVGDVTCLVGKNEAGKTALLKAIYRLNPVRPQNSSFIATYDYPRQDLIDYEIRVETGKRDPAEVIEATFELSDEDKEAVINIFGPNCFVHENPVVTLCKGYTNEVRYSSLQIVEESALSHLTNSPDLPQALSDDLHEKESMEAMAECLHSHEEQTDTVRNLAELLSEISRLGFTEYVYDKVIAERVPKFLYFDEYFQMKGHDNLEALKSRVDSDSTQDADQPLLGLIFRAGLDLEQLMNPRQHEALIARLEAAANQLTRTSVRYWSQNRHLRMKFDIRDREPEDPPEIEEGKNIIGRVEDTKHMVSTPLGSRSRGFLWFFSFLAWYHHLLTKNGNLILLLDEPGLSLHAKAQRDLLQFFEAELKPNHQVIYTTHSPFMVDPAHLDRVRIVQDLSIELELDELKEEQVGTRVSTEFLEATSDSLFPLQGALGYGITQSLFIGPNCLVVEGISDFRYLQEMSIHLQRLGRIGLKEEWTITPVGGSTNVPTFVALLGAQEDLNVAVLVDHQKSDQQRTENLFKEKLLKKSQVLTYADFVREREADIEDMFDPAFYLKLVNEEFKLSLSYSALPPAGPRIVRRLKRYFAENPLPGGASFNHDRPARYFSEKIGSLESDISEEVLDRFECIFKTLNGLL